MLLIILLEEVAGILHEAAYLTRQEHFRKDVAVVVQVLAVCCITNRDADCRAWLAAFNREVDRSKRLDGLLAQTAEREVARSKVRLATEEKAVGIDAPHIIIYSDLADACLQLFFVKRERRRSACRNGLEVEHNAIVHYGHAEFFACCTTRHL